MYSSTIIDRRLAQATKSGIKFRRLPREESMERAYRLDRLRLDPRGKTLPNGQLSRPLLPAEEAFIVSERLLCRVDCRYYLERYHKVEIDPGVSDYSADSEKVKISAAPLLESQQRYLALFGRREDECYAELAKYGRTDGILAYIHKVRQVAATSFSRGETLRRMIFWPGTRCLAASLDEKRLSELFHRDRNVTYNHLPFWMQPRLVDDVKNTELSFEHPISSRISYQAENAETGIGTGSQVDVSHLTEVGLWKNPGFINFSFVPGIPKAVTTLHIQESTAAGRGHWSDVTEAARHRRPGYESWIYIFIPWYMNLKKWTKNAPDLWTPSDHTVKHAELIHKTSPEFMDGTAYNPSRDQLYWWETERQKHAQSGELAAFLANYPATPEQSFQNPDGGALPVELLERMEQEIMHGIPYELETAA